MIYDHDASWNLLAENKGRSRCTPANLCCWRRPPYSQSDMVVAECGTGKTLISLGAIHVHSEGRAFTALTMVPPHLVEKWAREAFLTLPGVRVFLVDDLRNVGDESKPHGVNEVRLRQGRIVRERFRTTLGELRLQRESQSSRKRWLSLCSRPSLFIVGRERAKLGYFWHHAYRVPRSGPYLGCVVNADTGKPVMIDENRLTLAEFEKVKIAETVEARSGKRCRPFHSTLWQADSDKIRRMAPIEFIGRYMPDGLITRFATRFTSWPATPRKVMLSVPYRLVPAGLWA